MKIDPKAVALQPMRIRRIKGVERLILYTSITFPRDPFRGCELYLRRVKALFGIHEEFYGDWGVDVLDHQGDILQTFGITRNAFEYLRSKLKFKVEA